MSNLDKLIAAVEAGDLGVLSTTTLDPPSGYLTRDMARLCVHACDGSLDAAMRLHEALLPGWMWPAMVPHYVNGANGITVELYERNGIRCVPFAKIASTKLPASPLPTPRLGHG